MDLAISDIRINHRFAVLLMWAMRLLMLVWTLLLFAWLGLHYVIVPRISEAKPWLEQTLSGSLGIKVRIGQLQARTNGLIPSVDISDIELVDSKGRSALMLSTVSVAFSPASLVRGGLEQLYIQSPELDVRRDKEGRLWIAGLQLPARDDGNTASADWVFSQPEIAIRKGTIHWTDELRAAPQLDLKDVDLVIRNRHLTHTVRLDANPPELWGERLHLTGKFGQPFLSAHAGDFKLWSGQAHVDMPRMDIQYLQEYLDLHLQTLKGEGAVRAWIDLEKGEPTGLTTDVAMRNVLLRISPKLDPIAMEYAAGRLGLVHKGNDYEIFTRGLEFDTADGMHWPGGNVHLSWRDVENRIFESGKFDADRIDLAAVARIVERLPLAEDLNQLLKNLEPKGEIQQVTGNWRFFPDKPMEYSLIGKLQAYANSSAHWKNSTIAGIKGADVDFNLTQTGGKAKVSVIDGSFDLPGVLELQSIPLTSASADLHWKSDYQSFQLFLDDVKFANADAKGTAQGTWRTGSDQEGRLPGVVDLQAKLSDAQATSVVKYLPLAMNEHTRNYLRESIESGTATSARFKLKGNLRDFPFKTPKDGVFQVMAKAQNVRFAFAPASILPSDSLPWPVLGNVTGDFLIDNDELKVSDASGIIANAPDVHFSNTQAVIGNLYGGDAVLNVNAQGKGSLASLIAVVKSSPINTLSGKALDRSVVSGNADFRLKLGFPLKSIQHVSVQGNVTLSNNEIQLVPMSPKLSRVKAVVGFTEYGMSVSGAQARSLGGDVRIDGGLVAGPTAPKTAPQVLNINGYATAAGLKQAGEMGFIAKLGQFARGGTNYQATMTLRNGLPVIEVHTSLQGMALDLPAPLKKAEQQALPLHVGVTMQKAPADKLSGGLTDTLQVDVDGLAHATYVRDVSGDEPHVLQGAIAVGLARDESAPMHPDAVIANVKFESVDLDAWSDVLGKLTERPSGAQSGADGSTRRNSSANEMQAYLPSSIAIRADELQFGGRKVSNFVIGGSREGTNWRANVEANELSGYVEYRQSTGAIPGRLYARLARLALGASNEKEVESLLDAQPFNLPALDIVVDDFALRGKHLGRIEINAVNTGGRGSREWQLTHFNISTPEAVLTAKGNWANVTVAQPGQTRGTRERRRTTLDFTLDISDSGGLLSRLGSPGVVHDGKGKVQGQVSWTGSPFTLDYPSLTGSFNVDVENGQFLKADPGIAKLLGVLSLQSLPRRLGLDFRDVFSEGFAFDFFRGDVQIEKGMARTNNLQMKGVSAAVLMEGSSDLEHETQNIKVVVVPEINAGSASLFATAINPIVGLSTFLAQLILRKPLIEANTQELLIDGTWTEPRVTKVEHKNSPANNSPATSGAGEKK